MQAPAHTLRSVQRGRHDLVDPVACTRVAGREPTRKSALRVDSESRPALHRDGALVASGGEVAVGYPGGTGVGV